MHNKSVEPLEAYSLYVFGDLSCKNILDLTSYWLKNEIRSDSLYKLCYVDPTKYEQINYLFEATMQDLSIDRPTVIEAGLVIIQKTLQRIVKHEIDAEKGISYIYHQIYFRMEESITNESNTWSCFSPENNEMCRAFSESKSGIYFNLTQIFGWLRELWDCWDGSHLNFYADLPRDQAEVMIHGHLIEESRKWLETNKIHSK